MLKAAEITAFRQRLGEERAALERKDTQGGEDRRAVTPDRESPRLAQPHGRDAKLGHGRSDDVPTRAERLRIDSRDFGYCQECGEDIGRARLTLDPDAPSCLSRAKG